MSIKNTIEIVSLFLPGKSELFISVAVTHRIYKIYSCGEDGTVRTWNYSREH